ncbi:RNA pyrophosphohydrolase [Magnetospirillum aberrantis]|uniref:RNA pyrophosphohydrolase n=1 Tax=Magnetospirillum aberrantis SpK TaxID=908842 RepID=A0A7C9QW63_9PROT|nr:RNA pyrophosphohydrolase [Magnetospirillum aberrantis]NFV82100.1 RNA pyrophosphohydrolase [Magnetospirillum aberrantis SpK]
MSKLVPYHDRPYRPNVGLVLFNAHGLVFTARRIDTNQDAWQFPQGGIDDGEDPTTAALREMEEEIGTAKAEVIGESQSWFSYDLPPEVADRWHQGRWRGQKQKWFALRFLGDDSDINIATEHPEFAEWRWMRLEDVPATIVPFKRALYEQVVAEFLPIARSFGG